MRRFESHGNGLVSPEEFSHIGTNVIIESDVLVFHPDKISLGDRIYIGHQTILRGTTKAR